MVVWCALRNRQSFSGIKSKPMCTDSCFHFRSCVVVWFATDKCIYSIYDLWAPVFYKTSEPVCRKKLFPLFCWAYKVQLWFATDKCTSYIIRAQPYMESCQSSVRLWACVDNTQIKKHITAVGDTSLHLFVTNQTTIQEAKTESENSVWSDCPHGSLVICSLAFGFA